MWDNIIDIAPEQLPNAAIGVTATMLLLLFPTLFLLWTRRPIKQTPPPRQGDASGNGEHTGVAKDEGNIGFRQESSSQQQQVGTNGSHHETGEAIAAPKTIHGCRAGECTCVNAEAFTTSTKDHEKSNPAGNGH